MSRPTSWPRLMARQTAAAYCDMSVSAFERECPISPLAFGDKRLERYDRHDLDAWIDSRKAPTLRLKSAADALAEM